MYHGYSWKLLNIENFTQTRYGVFLWQNNYTHTRYGAAVWLHFCHSTAQYLVWVEKCCFHAINISSPLSTEVWWLISLKFYVYLCVCQAVSVTIHITYSCTRTNIRLCSTPGIEQLHHFTNIFVCTCPGIEQLLDSTYMYIYV